MKKAAILIACAAIAVGALYLFSVRDSSTGPTPVTIGVIAPLSGQYAFLGESERNAMLLAQAALKGRGTEVRLIFEDDKYDAKTGVSAYEKLKSIDKVDVVVAVSAPVLGALRPLVERDDMLLFALGESLFHEDDTVFQLMPASDKLGLLLAQVTSGRYERIAVAYSQDGALWQKWHDDFLQGVDSDTVVELFPLAASSDMKTETQKILAFDPDATTVFLPLADGVRYLENLKRYDSAGAVSIICDGNLEFSIGEYVAKLGETLFDGCLSTTLPDAKTPQFVEAYTAAYGADPVLTADYAYDAVSIVGELSAHDRGTWLAKLKDGYTHSGASGTITFTSAGTRAPDAVVHQYVGGKFVEVR